jgi:hypothetical protein
MCSRRDTRTYSGNRTFVKEKTGKVGKPAGLLLCEICEYWFKVITAFVGRCEVFGRKKGFCFIEAAALDR